MKDDIKPMGAWVFDDAVAERFSNMLERSIPDYTGMRDLVFIIGSGFVLGGTAIVDLGASTGESISRFVNKFEGKNTFVAVDNSEEMIKNVKANYLDLYKKANFQYMDLRTDYPSVKSSLTLSVLTLQFIPIEYRQEIIRNVYNSLVDDGALIIVEKILLDNEVINKCITESYYKMKEKNGYTKEDIDRKRLSLQGVLVPLKSKWNKDMLYCAGFKTIDCFWRNMNFEGLVAVK